MRVTRLAAAAGLVALLAAGCAGEPTGGQVEVQGVTSTAADTAAITEPARTERTATTRRASATTRLTTTTRPTTTTRRATRTSKSAANPILTVEIVSSDPDAVGSVQVGTDSNADAGTCPRKCSYTEFSIGTRIKVQPLETQAGYRVRVKGGQPTCDEFDVLTGCIITLKGSTTVTVIF